VQLAHADLRACGTEYTHVVLHVPVGEGLPGIDQALAGYLPLWTHLGEAVEPIGGGTHQCDFLRGDSVGHELVNGM